MRVRFLSFSKNHTGFTRTDLLVGIALVSLLLPLVWTPITLSRSRARLERCRANLNGVSRSCLQFAADHGQTLPGPVEAPGEFQWWYKEQVKSYLGLQGASAATDSSFACPDDRGYTDPKPFHQSERFDFSSYPFNGVLLLGAPNIAGWRLPEIRQPDRTLLVMEWTAHGPLSWHRSRTGKRNAPFYNDAESVVGFVDGHVDLVKIYHDGYNAAYTRDPIPGYRYRYSGR